MLDDHSLQIAVQNGIIDEDEIRMRIEMYEKDHYLKMHEHKIWEGSDGRWCTYVTDPSLQKGRRLIKKKNRSDLEKFIVEWHKKNVEEPKIEDVFYEWLNGKFEYGEIKKQTYDKYIVDYNRFFGGAKIKNLFFRHITEDILKDFIRSTIRDMNLTVKAWSNMRTLIYGMFKYAKEKGYTNIGITDFMGDLLLPRTAFRKRVFTSEESVFTSDEIHLIEDFISGQEPSLLNYGILLGFETGLRIGEIAALKASDFDLNVGTAIIRRKETKRKNNAGHTEFIIEDCTKGTIGARKIILTDKAVDVIKEVKHINPTYEYLFTNPETGKRIHNTYFSQKLTRICARVGIRKRSMHKARKTYATRLFRGSVDERIIMNQMGHTDISTTRRYYYFDNSTTEEKIEQVRNALAR